MLEDTLQTHVLDSATKNCKGIDVSFVKYEALKVLNSGWKKQQFLRDLEAPLKYLTEHLAQLWALYDSQAPDFKYDHSAAEMFDRRGFTQHPMYVASTDHVVAGLWIGEVTTKRKQRDARIHLLTAPECTGRGIATHLLKQFEQNSVGKYERITCAWGPRTSNPRLFFAKNGYLVLEDKFGGHATKTL